MNAVTTNRFVARFWGISFGLLTHALFVFAVWHIFWFLRGSVPAEEVPASSWWLIDLALALQFVVPHSLLLYPAVRERLGKTITGPYYGLVFCVVTCLCFLLTIFCWQPIPYFVWNLSGRGEAMVHGAFYASWGLLFYSLSLNGLGFQTGFLPWWHWLRGLPPPRRTFRERGIYRWIRHPTYLSFLCLIWFTPVMTYDRLLLCVVWTAYVFVGSALKDRRLVHYSGDFYRDYQARVPGYPGMIAGPLARVPLRSRLAPRDEAGVAGG